MWISSFFFKKEKTGPNNNWVTSYVIHNNNKILDSRDIDYYTSGGWGLDVHERRLVAHERARRRRHRRLQWPPSRQVAQARETPTSLPKGFI